MRTIFQSKDRIQQVELLNDPLTFNIKFDLICTVSLTSDLFMQSTFWGVSGLTGRAECPKQRLLTGKFLLTYQGKKRQGKKGVKIEKKRSKIVKGKGGKLKMEGGKVTK